MEIIDNVHKTLKDDLLVTLKSGSKVVIVALTKNAPNWSVKSHRSKKQMRFTNQPRRKRELFLELQKLKGGLHG